MKIIHLNKWYYKNRPAGMGHLKDGAHCGNGSYHALLTSVTERVTCKLCLKDIPPEHRGK